MTFGGLAGVAHQVPGRVRFRLQGRPGGGSLAQLEQLLGQAPGVRRVRINEAAASIVVEYDPERQSTAGLLALPVAGPAPRARVDESVVLAATPAAIWPLLDTFGQVSNDDGGLTVHPTGPGSWRIEIELLAQAIVVQVDQIEQEPPRLIVFRMRGALNGRSALTLTPAERGQGTRVREEITYTLANGLLEHAFGNLAEGLIRRLARDRLDALRLRVESGRDFERA